MESCEIIICWKSSKLKYLSKTFQSDFRITVQSTKIANGHFRKNFSRQIFNSELSNIRFTLPEGKAGSEMFSSGTNFRDLCDV